MDAPPPKPPTIVKLPHVTAASVANIGELVTQRALSLLEEDSGGGGDGDGAVAVVLREAVPSKIASLDDWPEETNLDCRNCTLSITRRPVFIPTSIRERAIGVLGVFCWFNCAAAFVEARNPGQENAAQRLRLQKNLNWLYEKWTRIPVRFIEPAPRHDELERFGGPKTATQLRREIADLDPKHGPREFHLGSVVPERLRAEGATAWDASGFYEPPRAENDDDDVPALGIILSGSGSGSGSGSEASTVAETPRADLGAKPEPEPEPEPEPPAPVPESSLDALLQSMSF